MDRFFSNHLQVLRDKLSILRVFRCCFPRCLSLKQQKEQGFVLIHVKVSAKLDEIMMIRVASQQFL